MSESLSDPDDAVTPEDEFLEAIASEGYAVSATPLHEGPQGPRRLRVAGALAIVAGVLAAVQGRANGGLSVAVGDPFLAAAISLGTGLLVLVVVVGLRPSTRDGLVRRLPRALRTGSLSWWQLLGGLSGAFFLATQSATVPDLGVALFTVLVVAGTTGSSLAFDAWGLGPGGRRPVTRPRVVGAVGTTIAVVIAVSGRYSAGSLALAAVVLSVTAGALSTFQQAINGQVATKTGDALVATFVNFLVAFSVIIVIIGVRHLALGETAVAPPALWSQPLLWTGGVLGIGFILLSASVVGPLGVLLYSLLAVGGQLVGSLLLDVVVPTPGTQVGWQLVLGVALTGLAVGYAAVRR